METQNAISAAESAAAMTHEKALQMLKEGNARFVSGNTIARNHLEQVAITGQGQYPFAVVLACIDSRVPSEILFDQGFGDIFTARVAGNFVNTDILGSMEFACDLSHAKLIVVLGHTKCGAVTGACSQYQTVSQAALDAAADAQDYELNNLGPMLKNIKPAYDAAAANHEHGEAVASNPKFVQAVADKNVQLTMENIRSASTALDQMIKNGDIAVVGAMYDVQTGKVSWNWE